MPEEKPDGEAEGSAYDRKAVEKHWQEWWEKEGVYHFDHDSSKPVYSIDNPPRYANAALHLGHATSYTQIDFAARYRRMRGYEVFFPLCADVNGMPIEVAVEKKFGVNKRNTDRQKLVKLCSEFASKNIDEMSRQFRILGHSMDPTIYYQTDAEYYRRITQLSFIELFRKGLVYKKAHPVTWCPHCGTALASADVEYEERETKLNFIRFGVMGEEGQSVTIATTRPELLCACQMVAVNPNDAGHARLVGGELLTPLYGKAVKVIADEKVDPAFGTGAVMICTIGDKGDIEWIYKYRLPLESSIDGEGRLTAIAGKYAGMPVAEARKAVVDDMQAAGLVEKVVPLTQSVGTCWRCHTPVEFLTIPQWFLKVMDFRDEVLRLADEVKWHPEFMKVRLREWANSLAWDWCISRQRYFATPIPVWECTACGEAVVADEKSVYLDPTTTPPPVGKCPKCGGPLKGCEDVFDTWMDSSITPLYNSFWRRQGEKDHFGKLFPQSLRPQSHDIIRTWAYYTIVRSAQLTGKRPWDHIMISGFIMAPDGTPMHTSRGNVINPLPILDQYGADAFRWFAATCALGVDTAFQQKEVVHGYKLCAKVWNILRFIAGAAGLPLDAPPKLNRRALRLPDRWILSRFGAVVGEAAAEFDRYNWDRGTRAVEQFVWHTLADHYLELVKHRLRGGRADPAARAVLYELGLGVIKLLATFLPHVTEELYQKYYLPSEGRRSLHTSSWPEPPRTDPRAGRTGEAVKDLVAALRNWRHGHSIGGRDKLPAVEIGHPQSKELAGAKRDIAGAAGIARLRITTVAGLKLREKVAGVRPRMDRLGPAFRADSGAVAKALAAFGPAEVELGQKRGTLTVKLPSGREVAVQMDMVEVVRETVAGKRRVEVLRVGEAVVVLPAADGR